MNLRQFMDEIEFLFSDHTSRYSDDETPNQITIYNMALQEIIEQLYVSVTFPVKFIFKKMRYNVRNIKEKTGKQLNDQIIHHLEENENTIWRYLYSESGSEKFPLYECECDIKEFIEHAEGAINALSSESASKISNLKRIYKKAMKTLEDTFEFTEDRRIGNNMTPAKLATFK